MTEPQKVAPVLAISGNYAVVHIVNRRHPALAIQGDSLKILQATIQELSDSLDLGDLEEAKFSLREIVSTVSSMTSLYEETSRSAGFELPYNI
ncbi:DUF6959 family protein [Streptomyces sp. HD]|uniref:DUF6959 family protein n=1 Tax=Streptomyces sp. HD TaxID=3020892 RepID=UPI00232E44D7|nr:hypothetical protein [Streptomyces sp. HD]MDC0772760.1 hypothetical protein [Streptomyces sp. HD]